MFRKMYDYCMIIAWLLHDYCMIIAWLLHDYFVYDDYFAIVRIENKVTEHARIF